MSRNPLISFSISRKYCPPLVFITSTHLPVVTSPIFISKAMWEEDREKIRSESFTLLSSFAHLATLSFILSYNGIIYEIKRAEQVDVSLMRVTLRRYLSSPHFNFSNKDVVFI